jgi:nitrogen regulatory protein PII
MKQPDCRLILVFPKALEENMVGHLLRHPDLVGGFTTVEVEGHGKGAVYHSITEQVRGRVRRVRMEIVMACEDARILIEHLKEALPTPEIAYWIAPVLEFGRFA